MHRRALIALCAVGLWGCGETTQLLVRFRTDIETVRTVRVTITAGDQTETMTFPAGPGEVASFGIVPPDGAEEAPVLIELAALTATTTVHTTTRRLEGFFEDRKAHVYVFIGRSCLDVACAETDTCNPCGVCEPIVPITQPSPPLSWTSCEPEQPNDAGPPIVGEEDASTQVPCSSDPCDDGGVADAGTLVFEDAMTGRDGSVPGDASDARSHDDGSTHGRSDATPGDVILRDAGDAGPLDDGRDAS